MDINTRKETPLRFSREPLISQDQAARIHELATQILQEIGLAVRHATLLERLREEGFRIHGDRVFFERDVVDAYVDEMRRDIAEQRAPSPPPDDGLLALRVCTYSLYVHDIETDRVVPYTTDRLIAMCKLVDTLADDGVSGVPPGIPAEEHPDLQPVAQYRIAALYARQGATPADPTSPKTVNYLLEMADVMGRPIRSLPVYPASPLCLGGQSLDVVLACIDHLSQVSIYSMPSTGTTAPIHPFGGLALAAAELMGSLVALRTVTGKPTTFTVHLFPFDLRASAMVFGSPENVQFQMLGNDLNRFYGWDWNPSFGNIHVMAKLPGAQAAAEKASIMSAGAFLGARRFSGAGALSLDEVFSPEQLLLDCEIRDWVQQAIQGIWMGEEEIGDPLAEIRAGLERGFMGLDSTLDHYNRRMWHPRRFERRAIGPWLDEGQPRLASRLRDEVRQRIASHDFELDGSRRQAIERIYQDARRAVAGWDKGAKPPSQARQDPL